MMYNIVHVAYVPAWPVNKRARAWAKGEKDATVNRPTLFGYLQLVMKLRSCAQSGFLGRDNLIARIRSQAL